MRTTDEYVKSIIAAFLRSLEIFKQPVERHRRKKARRKQQQSIQEENADEVSLSRSLRRGVVGVQREYERLLESGGRGFVAGDETAQGHFARILDKLNSGLIRIIIEFFTRGQHDVQLDYRTLTALSEGSRLETLEAMSLLSQRLSRSTLHLPRTQISAGDRANARHEGLRFRSNKKDGGMAARRPAGVRQRSTQARKPSPSVETEVKRVQLSCSSEPRLAMVKSRPKARRTRSSSVTNLRPKANSTANNDSTARKRPHSGEEAITATSKSTERSSASKSRSKVNLTELPEVIHPTSPVHHSRHRPNPPPNISDRPPSYTPPQVASSPETEPDSSALPSIRRRVERQTPSMYTFHSDSTKLGEIPMRRWNIPYDPVEAERLNAEYFANLKFAPDASEPRRKKGLFGRLFRKREKAVALAA